ncbi:MAG: AraC-like DNA-binding protein [Oceanospirillaceae bacterium]|jgi:AraC-like DNA-binding protein
MNNWKRLPQDSFVAKYVECYWLLEKEHDDVTNLHPKLNPNANTHLILASDAEKYHFSQGETQQTGYGSHWIFPHKKTFVMDHSQPFLILGIKFKVGALYSLSYLSPQLNLDKVVKVCINDLLKSDSFVLSVLLAQAVESPEQTCNILDQSLLPLLLNSHEDKHSALILRALPLLADTPISNIGELLHCSQRTIERAFLRVTKLTLKQYKSMIRLEQVLSYLYNLSGESINWAQVANQFEFSDQPHLIRYLKSTIGTTPGDYLRQRDLTIDVYGDFE